MTVTAEQIKIAKDAGMREVDTIAQCCNETGARFYIALAMLEKETGNCRNVYGHDAGGALSGFPGTVDKSNFAVFEWLVFKKGQTSNGVGPSQLTFKGFFTDMEAKGLKPYDLHDNIAYGIKLIQGYYRAGRNAGKLGLEVGNPGARPFDRILQHKNPGPDYVRLGSAADPRYAGKMPLLPPGKGPWQVPSPQWFSEKGPMLTSSALGFAATAGIRTIIPFAPAAPPPHIPAGVADPRPVSTLPDAPIPHGGDTITVTPWNTRYSTLWKISETVYGDGELWPLIYRANEKLIGSDPNVLHTGRGLVMPALVP